MHDIDKNGIISANAKALGTFLVTLCRKDRVGAIVGTMVGAIVGPNVG